MTITILLLYYDTNILLFYYKGQSRKARTSGSRHRLIHEALDCSRIVIVLGRWREKRETDSAEQRAHPEKTTTMLPSLDYYFTTALQY